jgi:hypothetical protein
MAAPVPRKENAFERCFREFKKDLSPEQLKDFEGATLEDLQITIAAIQKRQASMRTLQNLRRIEGFLEATEANSKVIEVFLNVHNFVAFIWVSSILY